MLLTHRHLDHSEGARPFAERACAPVRALDPTAVPRRGGARRRRGPGRGGARHPGRGDARAHHRLAVPGRRRRRQRPDRRHRPRPRHDRARRLRRRAQRLPRLAGPARRAPGGHDAAPGHGPDLADAPQTARDYLRAPRAAAGPGARGAGRLGEEPTPAPGRRGRLRGRRRVALAGRRPLGGRAARAPARVGLLRAPSHRAFCLFRDGGAHIAVARSANERGAPDGPARGSGRSCPRGAASRGRRSRRAPCSPSRGRRRRAGRSPPA